MSASTPRRSALATRRTRLPHWSPPAADQISIVSRNVAASAPKIRSSAHAGTRRDQRHGADGCSGVHARSADRRSRDRGNRIGYDVRRSWTFGGQSAGSIVACSRGSHRRRSVEYRNYPPGIADPARRACGAARGTFRVLGTVQRCTRRSGTGSMHRCARLRSSRVSSRIQRNPHRIPSCAIAYI
jgi:hypothetical protein